MEIVPVRGSGLCANSFILCDQNHKEILVIDIGLRAKLTRSALKKALQKVTNNNPSEYKLEVFLTHSHIDHILGEDHLIDFTDITFSSSKLAAEHINARDKVTLLHKYPVRKINYSVTKVYHNNDFLTIGKNQLKMITAPGHTDGSAVLYDADSKSLFSGDVVFEQTCGRMDFPTGDKEAMIKSLTKLTKLDVEHLYSGHGEDMHQNVNENIQSVLKMVKLF